MRGSLHFSIIVLVVVLVHARNMINPIEKVEEGREQDIVRVVRILTQEVHGVCSMFDLHCESGERYEYPDDWLGPVSPAIETIIDSNFVQEVSPVEVRRDHHVGECVLDIERSHGFEQLRK